MTFLLGLLLTIPLAQDLGPDGEERKVLDAQVTLDIEGVETIEVGSGIAVVACATAYYDTESKNPALVLQAQRWASLQATLDAQAGLMQYFTGLSVAAATEIKESMRTADSNESSLVRSELQASEGGTSLGRGVLRGAVVYRIEDRPDEGSISVWVVNSPKTRAQVRRSSPRGATYRSYSDGLAYIKQQVLQGVLPPTGAMILNVPQTGETAWVGFGSMLINPNSRRAGGRVAGMAKRAAADAAKTQALASLLACLNGKPISVDSKFSSEYDSFNERTENFLDGSYEQEVTASADFFSKKDLATIQVGETPPETVWNHATSVDGNWAYCFAILRGTKVVKEKPKRAGSGRSKAEGSQAGRSSAGSASPAGDGECVEGERKGIHTLLVTISENTRSEALAGALLEGLQRSKGFSIESSLVMQQQYADAATFVNGESFSSVSASFVADQNLRTHTSGVIDSYTVLSEIQGPSQVTLEVCVKVPVGGPARPGGKRVVAVLPFSAGAEFFRVNGEVHDAQTYTSEMESLLVDRLVESGKFYVLDGRNSDKVAAELAQIKESVASGKMSPTELARMGELKGTDLLITGSVDALEHEVYQLEIAARRRSETRERLTFSSQCRITSVTDGTIVDTSRYYASWGGDDVSSESYRTMNEMRSRYGGAELSTAAYAEAAHAHVEMALGIADKLMNAERLKVLETLEDGTVLLEAFDRAFTDRIAPGDVLQVKYRKVTANGRVFLLNRCLIELLDVQSDGTVIASVLTEGDKPATSPAPGDQALLMD
jgi:hypothetical protein